MDSLAFPMKELVQNVKIVAVPEAEAASAGRIRDIMMGSYSSSDSSGLTPASTIQNPSWLFSTKNFKINLLYAS